MLILCEVLLELCKAMQGLYIYFWMLEMVSSKNVNPRGDKATIRHMKVKYAPARLAEQQVFYKSWRCDRFPSNVVLVFIFGHVFLLLLLIYAMYRLLYYSIFIWSHNLFLLYPDINVLLGLFDVLCS